MALSEDQKAMLRLLAQREQGYGDIAALMGLSVEQVRERVREALAELDESAAAAPAAPPPPAPAKPKQEPQATPPPSPEPVARPEEVPAPASERGKAPAGPRRRADLPKLSLPEDRRVRRGLLGGAAVVVVLAILFGTGVFGGGSGSSGSGGEPGGAGTTAGGKQPTQAVLAPVGSSNAVGRALFGRSGQSVVLLLSAKGLAPSPSGQSYTVSLARKPGERLPLVATKVGKAGIIAGRFQVAPQVLGLLASGFDQMEVALVGDAKLKVALAQAKKSRTAPAYGGEAVLRGTVTGPIVEAGER